MNQTNNQTQQINSIVNAQTQQNFSNNQANVLITESNNMLSASNTSSTMGMIGSIAGAALMFA